MVTLTSSSSTPKTSFDFMKNNNNHSLYATFSSPSSSSYLRSKEKAVITNKKLMEPSKTLNMSIIPKEEAVVTTKKLMEPSKTLNRSIIPKEEAVVTTKKLVEPNKTLNTSINSKEEAVVTTKELVEPSKALNTSINPKEEIVVTTNKLMKPSKTVNTSINPKDEKFGDETKMVKKSPEDPEIGVFGAEKYFNGDMDSEHSSSVLSLTNPEVERFVVDSKKTTGTPSVRSESSWNSQSMLLQNKLANSCNGSLQEKKNNSGQIQKVTNNKKSFLSNLGCRCACSDGNSVEVDDKISVKRSSDSNISVSATRKIENQMNSSVNLNTELIKIQKKEELVHRKSLEVFGSPINIEKKRIVDQKKLTVLPWDSRTEEEDTKSGGSDSSSDLFEIESFKPKPFLTRQGSDPASPTCYAPSEVSIEWSIVTASAADFSVMSECATSPVRRNRSSQIPRIPNTAKFAPQRRKSSSSLGSGLLLGCKSHKSVRVSGDSDRRSSINKTQPSYVPRFPMESTKPKSFETRRRISNSSMSRTQSSLLYSQ